MANIKSKEKNIKRIEKSRQRNFAIKSKVKTAIKKYQTASKTNESNTKELLNLAQREIDRAVTKGVFHKKTAARKISRLTSSFNKLSA